MLGFISPISGSLYNKIGIKRLTFVGFLILTLASLPFGFLSDTTSPSLILVLYSIRMFGVALMMMPLTTNAMDALPTKWVHMVLLQITLQDKWHLQLPLHYHL